MFYLSGFLSNLRLPWKIECALNSLYWIYIFYHSKLWTTCDCTGTQSLPWTFYCNEIFFIFQDFWATCAWPENRVCPDFFQAKGSGLPPRPPASYATAWNKQNWSHICICLKRNLWILDKNSKSSFAPNRVRRVARVISLKLKLPSYQTGRHFLTSRHYRSKASFSFCT